MIGLLTLASFAYSVLSHQHRSGPCLLCDRHSSVGVRRRFVARPDDGRWTAQSHQSVDRGLGRHCCDRFCGTHLQFRHCIPRVAGRDPRRRDGIGDRRGGRRRVRIRSQVAESAPGNLRRGHLVCGLSLALAAHHLLPYIAGRQLGHSGAAIVLVATLLISWASTRWIEDPLRTNPCLSRNFRTTFLAALTSMAVLISVAFLLRADLDRQVAAAEEGMVQALKDPTGCTGPAALTPANKCLSVAGSGPLLAEPAVVARQNSAPVFPDCQSPAEGETIYSCVLGATGTAETPKRTVALIGDSHATHWFSAFDALGKERGWKVVTYTRSGCPFTAALRVLKDEPKELQPSCAKSNAEVLDRVLADPNIEQVFTSSFSSAYEWSDGQGDTGDEVLMRGVAEFANALDAAGKQLIVIRDVPAVKGLRNSTDCLAEATDVRDCGQPRAKAMTRGCVCRRRPGVGSARHRPDSRFCDGEWCHAVVGDVIVYRDYSHLSAEYSSMLAPYLGNAIP